MKDDDEPPSGLNNYFNRPHISLKNQDSIKGYKDLLEGFFSVDYSHGLRSNQVTGGFGKPGDLEEDFSRDLGIKADNEDSEESDLVKSGLKYDYFLALDRKVLHQEPKEYQEDYNPQHIIDFIKKSFVDCSKLVALADSYDESVNRNGLLSSKEELDKLMQKAEPAEKELLRQIKLSERADFFKQIQFFLSC